jgi:hypothetical protein
MRLKIVFLFFILALSTISASVEAQFSIGANAGVTRLKLSGDPVNGSGFFKPAPGVSSSIRLDYRFSEAVSISLQPGYSTLRSKYQVMNDSGTAAIDSTILTLKTFSLPLHALVWSENGRFYVLAGMQWDYTLSFNGETPVSPYSSSYTTTSYEVRDHYIYVQFGAGFIVPLGKPYLSFEFRYSQGLQDLTNTLFHHDSFLPRTKLTHTSFIVGLQIPLGSYSEKYKLEKKRR